MDTREHRRGSIGYLGETIASNYLINNDYRILKRNFCNIHGRRLGELDIVATDPTTDEIVFVEVKSLKNNGCMTDPRENITRDKITKLEKIIAHFLKVYDLIGSPFRLDGIFVILDIKSKSADLKHIKNIFI
jgi:putative endonuclease